MRAKTRLTGLTGAECDPCASEVRFEALLSLSDCWKLSALIWSRVSGGEVRKDVKSNDRTE